MKVLVVDDEGPARERLKSLLHELPAYQICGEARNGLEALRLSEEKQPDIVLMDIRMPGMDGLEAARHLARLDKKPPAIIFTTAYGDYALEAFQTSATGYLLKPVRKEHLERTLSNARRPNRAQLTELADADGNPARTHICARLHGNLRLIPIDDIFYFQADQKYVSVRHRQGEVLIEEPLKSLETELAPRFLRIHRNALVATAYVKGLMKSSDGGVHVAFEGINERLEVSRRHLSEVRQYLRSC